MDNILPSNPFISPLPHPTPPPSSRMSERAIEVCDAIRPKSNRTETSQEAAAVLMESGRASSQAATLLEYLLNRGAAGAADYQIVGATGSLLATVCSLRNALVDRGLIEFTGERIVNPNTNRPNMLWRATNEAMRAA